MSTRTVIGIVLLGVGVVAFTYQGITYTTREKVLDLGAVQVTADKTKTFPLPPIVGAIALLGGLALLIFGSNKSD